MFLFFSIVFTIVLLLSMYLPKTLNRAKRTARRDNIQTVLDLEKIKHNRKAMQGRRVAKNLVQMRIVDGKISTVAELNAELELCSAFDNSPIPVSLVDKILDITLQDTSACSVEKLISLEYIKDNIKPSHIASLKGLFLRHGKNNYLLAIEIFKISQVIEDCKERAALLDFISDNVDLPTDMLQNKLHAC